MTKKKIILCVTINRIKYFGDFLHLKVSKITMKQYTGKQWYERQSDYINDLSVYAVNG